LKHRNHFVLGALASLAVAMAPAQWQSQTAPGGNAGVGATNSPFFAGQVAGSPGQLDPSHTAGTILSIAANQLSLRTEKGDTVTVAFSANTRFLRIDPSTASSASGARMQPSRISAFSVGDFVTAAGQPAKDGKTLGALIIAQVDPRYLHRMEHQIADFGKTWMLGRITAIEANKIRILAPSDHLEHTVHLDGQTHFRANGQPATLADLKVGDGIRVDGSLKNGLFTATTVSSGGQRAGGDNSMPQVPRQPAAPPSH